MNCPKCGIENEENYKFCKNCGYNFNETKEEHKNNKTLLIIAIVLLAVSSIGLFFVLNNKSDKKENNVENKVEDNITNDNNVDETNDVGVSRYNFDKNLLYLDYLIKYDDEEAFGKFFGKDLINSSDISLDTKIHTALARYSYENETATSVSENEIIKNINEMYGDNLTSLNISPSWNNYDFINEFKYDLTTKSFNITNKENISGGLPPIIEYHNVKQIDKVDTKEVTLKVLYVGLVQENNSEQLVAYQDYTQDNAKKFVDVEYNRKNGTIHIDGKSTKEFEDKMQEYKFTFKKNATGYYSFVKVERVK